MSVIFRGWVQYRDTLKLVPFPSSEVPNFRELQVPNFQVPGTLNSEIKKLTKKCFFLFQQKNILDTAFCLSTHYSIAKLRA